MMEIRHHAVFLYPGIFVEEEGDRRRIPDTTTVAVLAVAPDNADWFAAEVHTATFTRYRSDEGDEIWRPATPSRSFRIYIGTAYTAEEVEALEGDHRILLSNMRGNGWPEIVQTRRGNWQPVDAGDIVLSPHLLTVAMDALKRQRA
jgi:hypothetical protein